MFILFRVLSLAGVVITQERAFKHLFFVNKRILLLLLLLSYIFLKLSVQRSSMQQFV